MKIDWEFDRGVVLATNGKSRAIITKRDGQFLTRIYDLSEPLRRTTAEKTCNNLIEALHWAEDELKFQTGRKNNDG